MTNPRYTHSKTSEKNASTTHSNNPRENQSVSSKMPQGKPINRKVASSQSNRAVSSSGNLNSSTKNNLGGQPQRACVSDVSKNQSSRRDELGAKLPSVTMAQEKVQARPKRSVSSQTRTAPQVNGVPQTARVRGAQTTVMPASNRSRVWNRQALPQGGAVEVKKSHKVRNTILIVLALFILLTGVMGVLAYMQVSTLKTEVSSITKNAKTVSSSMKKGEFDQGATAMRSVSSSVDAVKDSLDTPGITYFSFFPVIGNDISNVKTIVNNAQTILTSCAVPACEGLESAGSGGFITKDKTINYSALNAVLQPIKSNSATVSQAVENIQQACHFNIPQISNKVGSLDDTLEDVQNVIDVVGKYSDQIMSMLGANGNRKYLLVAQNTAEMRCTGGFPGSVGIISFENGKIVMGEFASGKEYIEGDRPASCAPTQLEEEIYKLGIEYTMDTGYDAHFPDSGKIWVNTYAEKKGDTVNGVISVSPSMVQSILKVVGEVQIEDGTVLNGDNATKVLQHDIYWQYLAGKTTSYDNDLADAAFASAAKKSFEKLFSKLNSSTMIKLLKTLPDAIDNREFMLYMSEANEQATVDQLGCSASLSSESSSKKIGFFCGVRSSCKLGWWLDKSFNVQKTGTNTFHVTATLSSALTDEELSVGGSYIMGVPAHGTVGDLFPYTYVFAPANSKITNMAINGEGAGTEYTQENRQLLYLGQISLMPQVSATVTFDVEVPQGFGDTLEVDTNPTLTQYR